MAERELELIMESLKSQPEERPLYLLAEQRHHALQTRRRKEGHSLSSEEYVYRKLHEAEQHFLTDKIKADTIWRQISQLYRESANHADHVQYALDRLASRPVEPLPPLEAPAGVGQHDS